MSRVVNTNSPGKRRHYHMRSCAELLRHLSQKQDIDAEACDMLGALVFSLQAIDDTLQEAIDAWEKRDYWMKAEQFRQEWAWVSANMDHLVAILREEDWATIPTVLARLFPHFQEITINKNMRSPDLWNGKYEKFQQEFVH
ncbi:MAG: hypothetical protein ACLFTK_12445 [Anaerolineales bacterium]